MSAKVKCEITVLRLGNILKSVIVKAITEFSLEYPSPALSWVAKVLAALYTTRLSKATTFKTCISIITILFPVILALTSKKVSFRLGILGAE